MRKQAVPQCGHGSPMSRLRFLELILDNIYNGVIVTDAEGYVIYFNKPYGQFLGIDPETMLGKHATEVIENTRMHIVAKTGKAEINKAHNIKGQNMVVQRIPIKQDGKVVAVYGQVMFKHVSDVGKARQRTLLSPVQTQTVRRGAAFPARRALHLR